MTLRTYLPYLAIFVVALAIVIDGGSRLARNPKPHASVTIVHAKTTPASVRKWMLAQGVQFAWVGQIKGLGAADCFITAVVAGEHVFSYCKLRQPGVVP